MIDGRAGILTLKTIVSINIRSNNPFETVNQSINLNKHRVNQAINQPIKRLSLLKTEH